MKRLTILTIAALLGACTDGQVASHDAQPPQRAVVLISGRDDHGLPAAARIGLADHPDATPQQFVPDGTLAAVLATRREWLQLRTSPGERPGAG